MGDPPRNAASRPWHGPHPGPPRSPAAPGEEGAFADAAIAAARIAQQLGWTPDIFWAATPADLRHALGVLPVEEAAGRDVLARLIKEFPDG